MTHRFQRRMQHLFSPEGEAAVAAIMPRKPLLAFDFDGTLAPIVATPDLARVPLPVSSRLRKLRNGLQLAVITGRSVHDVKPRLDFDPQFIIGNHGAEDGLAERERALEAGLNPLRELLARRSDDLARAGVSVEDKRLSVALHYRLSRDPQEAQNVIAQLDSAHLEGVRIVPGKMVANVVHVDAPDKAQALLDLLRRCANDCAIFVGDDVNDEPVFRMAQPGWLTVRVGRDASHSAAAFCLDGGFDLALFLDRLLQANNAKHPEPKHHYHRKRE